MRTSPRKNSLRFSGPLLVILLTTFMLGGLLTFSTIQNINREQKIMEDFLLSEGITLIRTFEAGARTTMMQEMLVNRYLKSHLFFKLYRPKTWE